MIRKHPLRAWRDERELSLQGAAEVIGVTRQCWYNWETGLQVPDSPNMRKIKERCGVTSDQLHAHAQVRA